MCVEATPRAILGALARPQWTVKHGHSPLVAGEHASGGAGGGWSEVLSGLKTLRETGATLAFQSGRIDLSDRRLKDHAS
jgi:hypothetical protein